MDLKAKGELNDYIDHVSRDSRNARIQKEITMAPDES